MMVNLFRDFFRVYLRYSLATWLNVVGLSLALAGFYIAAKQTWYEFSYDRCYPDYERIYRLEHVTPDGYLSGFVLPMLEQLYRDAPQIEAGGIERFTVRCLGSLPELPEYPVQVEMAEINRGFTNVFGFRFLEGSAARFERADHSAVIIPASLARHWFGSDPAVNRQIDVDGLRLTVTGVYADFPRNATITNKLYRPLVDEMNVDNSWGMANYTAYLKVRETADTASVLQSLVYPKGFIDRWEYTLGTNPSARLFPVEDIYFHSYNKPQGNIRSTSLFLCVTTLMLLVSVINFINFSMALAPTRVRSINTQKVMGASIFSLRLSILGEAVVLSLFSLVFALLFIQLLSYTSFSDFIFFDLSLSYLPGVIWLVAGWTVLLGLAAGIGPALYITSVPAAVALKASFVLSPKGKFLRNLMIGFQFFFAFILISQTLFIFLQNRHQMRIPLGFDKERIVVFNLGNIRYDNKYSASVAQFFKQLSSYAGTERVTTASHLLLNSYDSYPIRGNESITMNYLEADDRFLDMLGVRTTEGRAFTAVDSGMILVNESGKRKFELQLGNELFGGTIVGFIPDIRLYSARKDVDPLSLMCRPDNRVVYVKLKPGVDEKEAVTYIRNLVRQIGPAATFVPVETLNDLASKRYEKEQKEAWTVGLFCLTCLVITVMGVFGLVIFESQVRRKEIGLRRITGATVGEIILLFNRTFVLIVLSCFILSLPLSYYFASTWLEVFVLRIPVYWWVFALSLGFVLLVTTVVVTAQCRRIATSNPVDSIRNE